MDYDNYLEKETREYLSEAGDDLAEYVDNKYKHILGDVYYDDQDNEFFKIDFEGAERDSDGDWDYYHNVLDEGEVYELVLNLSKHLEAWLKLIRNK